MRVYCGAPIDSVSGDPFKNFDYLAEVLSDSEKAFDPYNRRFVGFNPARAYINAKTAVDYDYIVEINRYALRTADIALFLINEVQSFGLPYELGMCADFKIPMFCILKNIKMGVYLKHWLEDADLHSYCQVSPDSPKALASDGFASFAENIYRDSLSMPYTKREAMYTNVGNVLNEHSRIYLESVGGK